MSRHNTRDIYPATGTEITAKSWLTKAPMRMLMDFDWRSKWHGWRTTFGRRNGRRLLFGGAMQQVENRFLLSYQLYRCQS
jgi:hypothetical protein